MHGWPYPSKMTAGRHQLLEQAANLAGRVVFIGTSSWKYPCWLGMLYNRARYENRATFSDTRFKRDHLREYAEVFRNYWLRGSC